MFDSSENIPNKLNIIESLVYESEESDVEDNLEFGQSDEDCYDRDVDPDYVPEENSEYELQLPNKDHLV